MEDQYTAALHRHLAIKFYRAYGPEDTRNVQEISKADFDCIGRSRLIELNPYYTT
jgi:hypothetical protein